MILDDFGHERFVGLFGETLLWSNFRNVVSKLWTLWEMMMIGLPLLIMAPSPSTTSAAVASLMGMISPVAYEPDFRPYFTVHDPDFHQLVLRGEPTVENGLPRLIGVTNLYFLKVLKWDNVLSVGSRSQQGSSQQVNQQQSQLVSYVSMGGSEDRDVGESQGFGFFKSFRQRMAGPQMLMTEHVENLWTSYKSLTVPDKQILNSLQKTKKSDQGSSRKQALVKSEVLRHHFGKLTKDFLQPFKRYYEIPTDGGKVDLSKGVIIPEFSKQDLIEHLWNSELPSGLLKRFGGSAANLIEMYKRFMEGSNFAPWMRGKLERYGIRIPRELLKDLSNVVSAIPPEDEVALLDKFFALEEQLNQEKKGSLLAGDIQAVMAQVFHQLPQDMQYTLVSSPARASIIQGLTQ